MFNFLIDKLSVKEYFNVQINSQMRRTGNDFFISPLTESRQLMRDGSKE